MAIAVSLVIAVALAIPATRLALLWRRTGLMPEGLLALFFAGFAVGAPLRLFLSTAHHLDSALKEGASGVAMIGLTTALLGLAFFTRYVFRSTSGFAHAFNMLTALALWVGIGILTYLGKLSNQVHPIAMFLQFWALPIFFWAFYECTSHYITMGRQQKLGMGDSLVRNRFLLWSLWTGAFCVLATVAAVVKSMLLITTPEGQEVAASAALMLAVRIVALACISVAATSMWLSFFPPPGYVAHIRARAQAATDRG